MSTKYKGKQFKKIKIISLILDVRNTKLLNVSQVQNLGPRKKLGKS